MIESIATWIVVSAKDSKESYLGKPTAVQSADWKLGSKGELLEKPDIHWQGCCWVDKQMLLMTNATQTQNATEDVSIFGYVVCKTSQITITALCLEVSKKVRNSCCLGIFHCMFPAISKTYRHNISISMHQQHMLRHCQWKRQLYTKYY